MVRSELIQSIAEENQLPVSVSTAVVDSFFDTIVMRLADGGRVELRGFGSFDIGRIKARHARNPRTGANVAKPEVRRPLFRVSKLLVGKLNPLRPRRTPQG